MLEHHPSTVLDIDLRVTPIAKSTSQCKLDIRIEKSRNLPSHVKASSSLYVKCYLLPDKSASSKRKTKALVCYPPSPVVWEEVLQYDEVNMKRLAKERFLEITLWSVHRGSSNELLGQFDLGGSEEDGKHNWEEMLRKPGEWIACHCSFRK